MNLRKAPYICYNLTREAAPAQAGDRIVRGEVLGGASGSEAGRKGAGNKGGRAGGGAVQALPCPAAGVAGLLE